MTRSRWVGAILYFFRKDFLNGVLTSPLWVSTISKLVSRVLKSTLLNPIQVLRLDGTITPISKVHLSNPSTLYTYDLRLSVDRTRFLSPPARSTASTASPAVP